MTAVTFLADPGPKSLKKAEEAKKLHNDEAFRPKCQ
jgi:hypothetical protein